MATSNTSSALFSDVLKLNQNGSNWLIFKDHIRDAIDGHLWTEHLNGTAVCPDDFTPADPLAPDVQERLLLIQVRTEQRNFDCDARELYCGIKGRLPDLIAMTYTS
jgi:hypothetical protein